VIPRGLFRRFASRLPYPIYRLNDLENRSASNGPYLTLTLRRDSAYDNPAIGDLASNGRVSGVGTWTAIGGTPGSGSWEGKGYRHARALLSWKGALFVGLDRAGMNGGWSPRLFQRMRIPLSRFSAREYVYQFCKFDGDLIVEFGASKECAQIWRFRPTEYAT
jgi:hypothetical protein